jgi:hypothetical protein
LSSANTSGNRRSGLREFLAKSLACRHRFAVNPLQA